MAISLREAVGKTLAYSQYFGLPLTAEKLHRWLISSKVFSLKQVSAFAPKLTPTQIKKITTRRQLSLQKLNKAQSVANLLSFIPSIVMIGATGSIAVDNGRIWDDLDLFIITKADSLWLTRPLVILLLKILRLRRPTSLPEHRSRLVSNKVCDNLWLDTNSLTVPSSRQSLYTAHEVLQVVPLLNRQGTYETFIQKNRWVSRYLANAWNLIYKPTKEKPASTFWLVVYLNQLAFLLQKNYMRHKMTRETITLHSAYFHPRDLSKNLELYL